MKDQQSRIKALITLGKERGYLTYGEINDHLPEDMVDADQIEDIMEGRQVREPKGWSNTSDDDSGAGSDQAAEKKDSTGPIGCPAGEH